MAPLLTAATTVSLAQDRVMTVAREEVKFRRLEPSRRALRDERREVAIRDVGDPGQATSRW